MGKYECWGDDHEDLTDQVRAKVLVEGLGTMRGGLDVLHFYVNTADASERGHWRVVVKCSHDHDNSFEGNGVP